MYSIQQRDGLTILHPIRVGSEPAFGRTGRGLAKNDETLVGVAKCDVWGLDYIGLDHPGIWGVRWHRAERLIIATTGDVHHIVLTPEQAGALGKMLIKYAKASTRAAMAARGVDWEHPSDVWADIAEAITDERRLCGEDQP